MKKYSIIIFFMVLALFSMSSVVMARGVENADVTVSMEVDTFEDEEAQDRPLSDWDGRWQSAYPFALDGSLDEVFSLLAETGKMTAEEYKEYYEKALETDIAFITIDGENNTIEYEYTDGHTCKSEYQYVGYYIQEWSVGTKAALYRFEAVNKDSGAPIYIELNDHIIKPAKSEYFHFRYSDTSFDDIEDPENRWAKFYPADLDAEGMLEAFILHDHTLDSSTITVPTEPSDSSDVSQDLQFVLYVGTNDKDTNEPVYSPEESKEKAKDILLDFFGGYTIQDAAGGWIGDDGTEYREYTMVIYLSDTTIEKVHEACDEFIKTFNQSSILIHSNPTQTEFYSGESNEATAEISYEEFKSLTDEEQIEVFSRMTGPQIYALVASSDESWPVTDYDLISPDNAKETIILVNNNGDLHFNLAWPHYGGFLPESIASMDELTGKLDVSRDGGDGGHSMSYGKNEDGSYPNDSQRSVPKTSATVRTGILDVDQYNKVAEIVTNGESEEERITALTDMGYDNEIAGRFVSDQAAWLGRDEVSGPDNIDDGAKKAGNTVDSRYGYYGITAPWIVDDLNLVGGNGQLETIFSWGTLCDSGLITDTGTAEIH